MTTYFFRKENRMSKTILFFILIFIVILTLFSVFLFSDE